MLRDDSLPVDDAPEDDGPGAPRQSYNFAPGYHGIIYRADVPDYGAGPAREHHASTATPKKKSASKAKSTTANTTTSTSDQHESEPPTTTDHHPSDGKHFILQSMKWGLIPFWTKRNPGYGSLMKTIN